MPTFTVRAPDGRTFKVQGPEGSTAAQAQAQVQSHLKAKQRTAFQTAGDVSGAFLNGIIPGAAPAVRGVRGVVDNAVSSLVGRDTFHPSRSYTEYARREQGREEDFKRDYPNVAGAAGWGGFGASILALPEVKLMQATKLAPAARTIARGSVPASVIARAAVRRKATAAVVNASATGAAYGAGAGALQGEGTDRITNAVQGGVAGGLVGAAAAPVIGLAVGGAKRIARVAAPYLAPKAAEGVVARNAQRRVMGALEDRYTPAEAAAEIEARSPAVPAMPADLTDQTRQMVGNASRGLGPAQFAVREAVAARQANAVSRVQSHLTESLGPTVDPYAQSQRLTDQGRRAAAPLYDAAYQEPVTVTPELREFMDSPQGAEAMKAGMSDIANTPAGRRNVGSENPTREGVLWDPELGAYRSGHVPVAEAFDGAKRHLDNIVSDGQSRFIAQTGTTTNTRPAELQRQDLLAALDSQNPAYAAARAAYAGPIADREAFRVGRQELPGSTRKTLPDARHQMSGITESQLAQFQLGDRTRIADTVNTIPVNGDATRPLNGTDARSALIREIHGNEASDRLQALTANERDAHLTYREVFGNSATANREAVDSGMGDEALLYAGAHLAKGNFKSAAGSLLSGVMTGHVGRYGHQLKGEIGRILTETAPANVTEAMTAIQARANKDAAFAASLRNFSDKAGRVTATQFVGHSGDRTGMYEDDYATP